MKTKIILEVGYNHIGNFEIAKQMIDIAAKLNVWGIKFQKWDIENIPEDIKIKKRTDKHAFGKTYYEHRKYLEFSLCQILELKKYAEDLNLNFVCSGKDFESLKLLVNSGIKYIKIPSQGWLNESILRYLTEVKKEKDLFIFASTGMSTHKEIMDFKHTNNKIYDVIMHCVSLYPPEYEDIDLNFLNDNRSFYNGYSSHEINGSAIKYAVNIGMEWVERHYTLNKLLKGTDHIISSTPEEIKKIQSEIEIAETLRGNDFRQMTKKEYENRNFYRNII